MTPNSASAAEIRSPYTVELATDMTTAELHLLQDKARQFENTEWEPTMIADQEDTFSMAIEDLSRGNQADKDLDMRPSKHEPEVSAEEVELRFDTYQTEPTFRVPKVLVEHITNDRAKLTPGYYFYGPYEAGESGPLIFDQDGQLVYWGVDEAQGRRIKNFSPCDYMGYDGDHLCWSEAFYDEEYGHEYVTNHVLDNTYTPVGRSYSAVGGWNFPNNHEYNMLHGGQSFLQAVYQFSAHNLSAYGGPEEGWVHDGCFQEIDVASGNPLFSWCALDHFSLDDSYMYLDIPGQTNFTEGIGGNGSHQRSWDFIHLNAVDRFSNGDYLVSSRHFNSIFKIAGNSSPDPGHVIWHLGGKQNDFEYLSNFTFSRQHHARVLSTSRSETMISLLNNGFNVRNSKALQGLSSSGLILKLNEDERTVDLVHQYLHPDHEKGWRESVAIAEGSFQVLESGNAVADWGSMGDVTEYAQDGEVLFHASVADHHSRSYRAFKANWTGQPHWSPKLFVYTATCSLNKLTSPLTAHVSWNGATEVVAWKFSVSPISSMGPWFVAGTFAKSGFETRADLSDALSSWTMSGLPFVRAVALDAKGEELSRVTVSPFVPSAELKCDANGCMQQQAGTPSDISTFDFTGTCIRTHGAQRLLPVIFLFAVAVVLLEFLARVLGFSIWRRLKPVRAFSASVASRPGLRRQGSGPYPFRSYRENDQVMIKHRS